MDRRSIIKNAGIAGVLAAGAAPAVHAQTSEIRWRRKLPAVERSPITKLMSQRRLINRSSDRKERRKLGWRKPQGDSMQKPKHHHVPP